MKHAILGFGCLLFMGLSWEVGAFSEEDLQKLKATNECVGCNLSEAELGDEDLSGADLSGADLSWSDLSGANLSGANLTGAYLTGANLTNGNLSGANLTTAHIKMLKLTGAQIDDKALASNDSLKEKMQKLEEEKKRIASIPGFRDLKPGITHDELKLLDVCFPKLSQRNDSMCYGIDNIKFGASFQGVGLSTLTIDLGPRSGGGFVQAVNEMVDGDPLLNMRGTLGSKYVMDYDWSERDRQLFNAQEKENLYTVYAKGQVALRIHKNRSYVEYREAETARKFLEENKPEKAESSDF